MGHLIRIYAVCQKKKKNDLVCRAKRVKVTISTSNIRIIACEKSRKYDVQSTLFILTLLISNNHLYQSERGWLGVVMRSCILHYRGIQLILAYSWAKPAILVAGKGRVGMFLFLLFLHFYSCASFFPVPLFHLLYYLFYHFSSFLWKTTQNDPQGLPCRKPQHSQSK